MPARGVSHPALLPAPLYQGSANTWECDDGGHLNIRFHLERALIGLAHFAHALEMKRAFCDAACATLVPLEAHMRFLKEARPGAPLIMHGGVVSMSETEAQICLDMRHSSGAPSSAFTLRVMHAETRDLRPFAWSARSRAVAKTLACALPAHAKPRSVDVTRTPGDAHLRRAREIGATRIGAAMVSPDQCDAFGRMRGEHFVGRVSDSVPNLLAQWRKDAAAEAGAQGEAAGAVVEARLVLRRWPRAGDLMEIYTGVTEVGEKTQRLVHWLLDPASGAAWASFEVIALTFDVATRKTIQPSPQARARMAARVVQAMTI